MIKMLIMLIMKHFIVLNDKSIDDDVEVDGVDDNDDYATADISDDDADAGVDG